MGWFLSANNRKKKQTGKKKRRTTGRGASPKPWDPHRTLRALQVLGALALVIAACIGWRYAERALTAYATQRYADRIEPGEVELAAAPPWLTEADRQALRALVADRVVPDPLDRNGLAAAADALAAEAWVHRVAQVRRVPGGTVRVHASYREPIAVVRARHGYQLIDRQGVVLPGLYTPGRAARLGLPVIVGVRSAPPGEAGALWPGDDVQAALRLVQELEDEPYANRIQAYDVSHIDARGRLRMVLHTDANQIVWGLPPGESSHYSIEADTQTKEDLLREVVGQPGVYEIYTGNAMRRDDPSVLRRPESRSYNSHYPSAAR